MANIQVSKLSQVDGQRRQAPPEMGEVAARKGKLYVLVEVSAPTESWDQASRKIVAKALNTFAASKMGETTALQAAAEAINDMLLAQNKELPREQHIWAGFNAVYIRSEHLYLAQAGPALTYIARGASVTRFPKSFDDLQTQRMEALIPLGERPGIKCRLAHFTMESSDTITMAASHLPTLGLEGAINAAMQGHTAEDVAESLHTLARKNDFSAYIIQYDPPLPAIAEAEADEGDEAWEDEWVAEGEDAWDDEVWEDEAVDEWGDPAPLPPPVPKVVTPPTRSDLPQTAPVTSRARPIPPRQVPQRLPTPTPTAAERKTQPMGGSTQAAPTIPTRETGARATRGETTVTEQKENRPPRPARATPALPSTEPLRVAGARGVEAVKTVDWQGWLRRAVAALMALGAGLLGLLGTIVGWWKDRIAPRVGATAPALDGATHRASHVSYRAWNALEGVLRGVLPGDRPARPLRDDAIPPPPGDGSGFLRVASLLLPLLLILAVVVVGWGVFGGDEEGAAGGAGEVPAATSGGESAALIGQARELLAQANNVDEATAQTLAQQAGILLQRAEPMAAGDPVASGEIAALRQQAEQLLGRAGTIARPPTITLATFDAGSNPSMLVQGGGDLYLIENTRAAVYRIIVNPQQSVSISQIEPLLTAQETLSSGLQMGTPQFLSWVPAGGARANDSLLILTQEGQLFDLDGTVLKQSDFSVVATQGFEAAEGYGGNLYLLDPTNKEIWKYVPDGAGQYSLTPEAWMMEEGQQQLGSPIDMAIDGYIFVLDQGGQVTRFQVGKPKSGFALDPVTPPLTQPVAMAKVAPESTDLFLADAQRVLRFDQNGRFLVEYRAPLGQEWGAIQDISMDPKSETLYILSNTGVHMVDLRNTRPAPRQ